MKNNEKASLQVLKILVITIILISACSILSKVCGLQVNNVKIVLSNNYQMNVLTSKTKISEILEENHIAILPDETVFPDKDAELAQNRTIIISKVGALNENLIKVADKSEIVNVEDVLGNYASITEKIEEVEETIPYETITKNADASSNENRGNKVLQEGKDGLRIVTYKVKYQNDIEISRETIKENIVKKPVNKIVQITKQTSRNGEERKATSQEVSSVNSTSTLAKKVNGITPIVKTLNTSAYTASTCGKSPNSKGYGKTANGSKATAWYTVAAGKAYPMGTVIYIPALKNKPNGGWFVVQDRGGAIKNNKLDIYMNTYNECISFGRKNLECYIYVK